MRGWTKDEIRKSKAPLLADRVVAWRRRTVDDEWVAEPTLKFIPELG